MRVIILIGFVLTVNMLNAQCDSITLSLSGTNPTCHDFSDGSVIASFSGNNGFPDIIISDSAGNQVNAGGAPNEPNLIYGWYYVEITDDSGCVVMDSIYLVNPPQMQAQITFTDPTDLDSCNGIAEVDTVLFAQGNYTNIGYFWSPGGPSGIGETIKDDLCNDFYSLTINDAFGCSIVIDIVSGSASAAKIEIEEQPLLYPNPVQKELHINPAGAIPQKYEIYSMSGQLMLSGTVENAKIDFTDLVAGQYLLKLSNDQGIYIDIFVKE